MEQLNIKTASQTWLPSVLSGLLLGLSYPSYPYVRLEGLAWIWMVPLLLSLKQEHSFPRFLFRVVLATLITCVFGMHWLLASTIKGTLLVVFIGTGVFAVPFVIFYLVRRSCGWHVALWSMPVVCTAWEWLYQRSEGSFAWLGTGVTQANLYWLVQYIDITGVWGITFWLALFNVVVVMAWEGGSFSVFGSQFTVQHFLETKNSKLKTAVLRLAAVSVLMLIIPLSYSSYIFIRDAQSDKSAEQELSVLLVQPNVNPWQKLARDSGPAVLRKIINLTNRRLDAAPARPDLIIWPETAVPYALSENKAAREALYHSVARWQTPLLTGLLDANVAADSQLANVAVSQQRELFNSAALLSPRPQQPDDEFNVQSSPLYHKRVLVPFVERVPFVDSFPALRRFAFEMGAGDDVVPGREATVFSFRTRRGIEAKVAAAICYESLYSTEVAELVRGGAQLLALITNEGWFSRTHGEYQIAAFSRLRSIETRRSALRAANTGISWLVDPQGRIHEQAPWWSEQTLQGRVTLSNELSLYVRYPDYFPKTCAWLALALLLTCTLFRARSFRRSRSLTKAGREAWIESDRPAQT